MILTCTCMQLFSCYTHGWCLVPAPLQVHVPDRRNWAPSDSRQWALSHCHLPLTSPPYPPDPDTAEGGEGGGRWEWVWEGSEGREGVGGRKNNKLWFMHQIWMCIHWSEWWIVGKRCMEEKMLLLIQCCDSCIHIMYMYIHVHVHTHTRAMSSFHSPCPCCSLYASAMSDIILTTSPHSNSGISTCTPSPVTIHTLYIDVHVQACTMYLPHVQSVHTLSITACTKFMADRFKSH